MQRGNFCDFVSIVKFYFAVILGDGIILRKIEKSKELYYSSCEKYFV